MTKKELARLIFVALISFAAGAAAFGFFPKEYNVSLQLKVVALVIAPLIVAGILEFGRWLGNEYEDEGELPE